MWFTTLIVRVLESILLAEAVHWEYTGENAIGPEHWEDLFPDACAGMYQSPINIVTQDTVYDLTLEEFVIFYDPSIPDTKFVVQNNGHTIQVNTLGMFFVSNGGLQNVFRTAQFHFHWGSENDHGSEHTIEGQASPLEMHIVNWNSDKYNSFFDAAVQPDGLAVLGILFEISKKDNPFLDSLISALVNVRDPDLNVAVEIPAVSVSEFLPHQPKRFFRYKGSLTTPLCFESVTWTVFQEKLAISERQLDEFRNVLTSAHIQRRRSLNRQEKDVQAVFSELGIGNDVNQLLGLKRNLGNAHMTKRQTDPVRKALVDNYRPVQPLNGRTVYRSFRQTRPLMSQQAHLPSWRDSE